MIKKFTLVILLSLACFFSAAPFSWSSSEPSSLSEPSTSLKKKKKSNKKKTKKKKKILSKKKKSKTKRVPQKAKRPSQKMRKKSRLSLPPEDETPSLMASLEDGSTAFQESVPPPPEEDSSEVESPTPAKNETEEATPDASPSENSTDELAGGTTLMKESSSDSIDTSSHTDLPTPSEVMAETEVAPVPGHDPEKAILLEKEPAPTPENEKIISIEDAMVGAYQQSDLLSSEYHVKSKMLSLEHAKRGWLPVAGANAGYRYKTGKSKTSNAIVPQPEGNLESDSKEAGVEVSQNIYQGGTTVATILASSKDLEASYAEYLAKAKEVLMKSVGAYTKLFLRQEAFRLSQSNQKLLEETLEVNKNRYEFGELTRYDVAVVQAKLDKAKSEVINAFADVEKAKAVFLKETGVVPTQTLKKAAFPGSFLPKSKDEAMKVALKNSPELKREGALAEAAAAKADVAFGPFLPRLDVNASATRTLSEVWNKQTYYNGGHGKTHENALQAGATLKIPLDFGGVAQTNIRADKYAAAQRRLMALYMRRDVLSSVSQAWDDLEAAKAKIAQVNSQVEAAKVAVDVVREEFLAGTKTTLEVVSAEHDYFSAQIAVVEAEQQEIITAYDLLNKMGVLTAETLGLSVNTYTPDKEKVPFWGLNMEPDARLAQQEALNTNMGPWENSL